MNPTLEKPFLSPEEEIQWLKKRVKELEEAKEKEGTASQGERQFEASREALKEMAQLPEEMIGEKYRFTPEEVETHTHILADEPHHQQTDELIKIAKEKGFMNALKVARALHNEHFLDDFHDRYVAEKYEGNM